MRRPYADANVRARMRVTPRCWLRDVCVSRRLTRLDMRRNDSRGCCSDSRFRARVQRSRGIQHARRIRNGRVHTRATRCDIHRSDSRASCTALVCHEEPCCHEHPSASRVPPNRLARTQNRLCATRADSMADREGAFADRATTPRALELEGGGHANSPLTYRVSSAKSTASSNEMLRADAMKSA